MNGRPWTNAELRILRRDYERLGRKTLAVRFSRTPTSVRTRANKLGLTRQHRIPKRAVVFVRSHYGKLATRTIAARLNMTLTSVYQLAVRLGLSEHHEHWGRHPQFIEFLRDKHAMGWSDAEIAKAWGCERHCVGDVRPTMH